MHMEVVDDSPELAAQRLTRNTDNRPLGKATVQQPTGRIQRGLGNAHRRRDDSREHLVYHLKACNARVESRSNKLLRRSPDETMPRISGRPALTSADNSA